MKKFISIFSITHFLIILFFLSPITGYGAEEIGCCIKTNKNNNQKSYMDATKTECEKVPQQNSIFTVSFEIGKIAFNNERCIDNPQKEQTRDTDPIYFTPGVTIPSSNFNAGEPVQIEESTATFANYIVAIFKYSLGVIGIIAAIALMGGGIIWLTAGGNHERISSAKTIIGGGLAGLCIAFTAFLLLSIVNTNLVNFKITPLQKLAYTPLTASGCCKKYSQNPLEKEYTTATLTEDQCEKLKEQIGPDGYKDIAFIPYAVAKNDECDALGCCTLSGGSQIRQYIMYESECKAQLSIGGLAEGFSLMSQEELKNKRIGGACVSQDDLTN